MRRRLALVAAMQAAVVALLVLVPAAAWTVGDREMADARRQIAAVGFVVARTPDPAVISAAFAAGLGPAESANGRIVVIMPDGTRIGRATALRTAPVVPYGDLARARAPTASVDLVRGGDRIILQPVPAARGGTAVIQFWAATRPAWPLWWVLPALLAVAVAAALGRHFGARGARLVRRFARAAAAVRDGEVVVVIEPAGLPELRLASEAFSAMSQRVAARLDAERRASGDLSHRLRTPLAALRLRVDRLGAGAREDAARSALDRLEQEIDLLIRSTRLPGGLSFGGCDAAEVVTERAAYWSALAEDQERTARVSGPGHPVPVAVDRDRLASALDALIGNVFHHTPEGTAYHGVPGDAAHDPAGRPEQHRLHHAAARLPRGRQRPGHQDLAVSGSGNLRRRPDRLRNIGRPSSPAARGPGGWNVPQPVSSLRAVIRRSTSRRSL